MRIPDLVVFCLELFVKRGAGIYVAVTARFQNAQDFFPVVYPRSAFGALLLPITGHVSQPNRCEWLAVYLLPVIDEQYLD
jgi:hypothetical protein